MMKVGAMEISDFQKQVGKEAPGVKITSNRYTEDTFHYGEGKALIGSGMLEEKLSMESVIILELF